MRMFARGVLIGLLMVLVSPQLCLAQDPPPPLIECEMTETGGCLTYPDCSNKGSLYWCEPFGLNCRCVAH